MREEASAINALGEQRYFYDYPSEWENFPSHFVFTIDPSFTNDKDPWMESPSPQFQVIFDRPLVTEIPIRQSLVIRRLLLISLS